MRSFHNKLKNNKKISGTRVMPRDDLGVILILRGPGRGPGASGVQPGRHRIDFKAVFRDG